MSSFPRWEVHAAPWHKHADRGELEAAGWEPFAATESEDGATVWYRRQRAPTVAEVLEQGGSPGVRGPDAIA